MKKFLLCFVLLLPLITQAERIDYVFLHQINGTKWVLEEEKEMRGLSHKKNKSPKEETITFSDGSILFDLPDAHYACSYTVKNRLEFWLYCNEPNQYVYKIRRLSVTELVMDVLVKNKNGTYTRKKRVKYHRKMN
jgi:hypothetical protein